MSREKPSILLVEDEEGFRQHMRKAFGTRYRLVNAHSAQSATKAVQNGRYDLILLDLSLDEYERLDGLALIEPFKAYAPGTPLVIVTKDQKSKTAVNALKAGADDFVRKDEFDKQEWIKLFERYLEAPLREEQETPAPTHSYQFIGISQQVIKIKKYLERLSALPDITILLTGETGVGKEVAARYLHRNGKRKDKPFKAVNLSVVTPSLLESTLFGHRKGAFTDARQNTVGAFEEAHEGILFLDEIGDVSPGLQVKLLRFLEDKKISPVGGKELQLDVQIVAATNKDLMEEVREGRFREDLYYRLHQFEVEIPALRERPEDINLLIDHYLGICGESPPTLDPEARRLLQQYPWPGNIRELVNIIKRVCVDKDLMGKERIDITLLPKEVRESRYSVALASAKPENGVSNIREQSAITELEAIEEALMNHSKKGEAASSIGLNLDKMKYRIDSYFEKYPQVFHSFPEIRKRYKLNLE